MKMNELPIWLSEIYEYLDYDGPIEDQGNLGSGDLKHVDIRPLKEVDLNWLYVPRIAAGSDYSGDSVTRSNYLVLEEMAKDRPYMWTVVSGYDGYEIAIRIKELLQDKELMEIFDGLMDYPVIDEQKMSEVEMEAEDNAWDSWLSKDFNKMVEAFIEDEMSELDEDDPEDAAKLEKLQECLDKMEVTDSDSMRRYFEKLAERANEYWIHETGNQATFRIERLEKHIKLTDFEPFQPDPAQMELFQ